MKEIEKTTEEKNKAVAPTTPSTGNGTQPGQQQKETPSSQNKKISDTPDTDEQKEETVKGETAEEQTTGSQTAVDSTEERESEEQSKTQE